MANKVESSEDVFQEACESALRLSKRADRPFRDLVSNQVFWRTNEFARRARSRAERCQSISDIVGDESPVEVDDEAVSITEALFPTIENGYEHVDQRELIARIHEQIPAHLVQVAELRMRDFTNEEIATFRGCPIGTVQYHWESYLRKARQALVNLGLSTNNINLHLSRAA